MRSPNAGASGSLKARCVEELEGLFISGALPVGAAVPPERELAPRLGVSRPVVHEAMVELAAKGFVRVLPRRGAVVNDFYREGTLAVYEAIALHGGDIPGEALRDCLGFRRLIEVEAARLAALRRGGEYLPDLLAAREELAAAPGPEADLAFHLAVARASGSIAHPLVLNSLRPLYRSLVARFYAALGGSPERLAELRALQDGVIGAICDGDPAAAAAAMGDLLDHGAAVIEAASP